MKNDVRKKTLDALLADPGEKTPPVAEADLARLRRFIVGPVATADTSRAAQIWTMHADRRRAPQRKRGKLLYFAAAAVATAAASLLWIFLPRQQPEASGLAHIQRPTYTRIGRAIELRILQSAAVTQRSAAGSVHLVAQSIEARVDFRHAAGVKTLTVETPLATFLVVGTSFSLRASSNQAELYVAEGKVKVASGGHERTVVAGESWQTGARGETLRSATDADKMIYRESSIAMPATPGDLLLPPTSNAKPDRERNTARPKPASRLYRIRLTDGSELTGTIVSQNAREIVLALPLADMQRLRVERERIISIAAE